MSALNAELACFNLPVGEHVQGEDGGAGQGEGYQDRPEQSGANRCVSQVLNSLREENIFDTSDQAIIYQLFKTTWLAQVSSFNNKKSPPPCLR